jgi:hypothetical protein
MKAPIPALMKCPRNVERTSVSLSATAPASMPVLFFSSASNGHDNRQMAVK